MIAVRRSSVASVPDTCGGKVELLKECAVWGTPANFRDLLRALGRLNKKERGPLKAVIIHTRDTPCPWLNVCDPNMEPDVFCQSTWCNERFTCIRTPTTSKKKEGGEDVERLYDHVIACGVCKVELQRVGQSGFWHGTPQPRDFSIEGRKGGQDGQGAQDAGATPKS